MSSDELRAILGGPEYVGRVAGVKQEYHVFRTGKGDFVVFSKSNRSSTSFHMTFVASAKAEALSLFVPEKGTSSGSLLREKKVAEIFGIEEKSSLYFEVLTALYVLAARGVVEITKSGRNLVFTPKANASPEERGGHGPRQGAARSRARGSPS